MKKTLKPLVLSALAVLALASCGGKTPTPTPGASSGNTSIPATSSPTGESTPGTSEAASNDSESIPADSDSDSGDASIPGTSVSSGEAEPLTEFPLDELTAFFADYDIDAEYLIPFVTNAVVTYEIDDSVDKYFDIYVNYVGDVVTEDMDDYATLLEEAGWTVLYGIGDYRLTIKDEVAYVDLLDYSEDGYIQLSFFVDDPYVKDNWTIPEMLDMMGALYGETLPYTGKDTTTVTTLPNDGGILLSGGEFAEGELLGYAGKFAENDWEVEDASASYGLAEGTVYVAEKGVTITPTEGGDQQYRRLRAMFYCATAAGMPSEGGIGTLALMAADVFDYEFPAETVATWAKRYFGSDYVIPAIDANCYAVDNNALSVTAYIDGGEGDDAGYGALLSAAGFIVSNEKGKDGRYAAYPGDYSYKVKYLYENGRLEIIVGNHDEFPTMFFETLVAKYADYGASIFDFPVPEGASSYQAVESARNAMLIEYYGMAAAPSLKGMVYSYGFSEDDFADYIALFTEEDGWTLEYDKTNEIYTAKLVDAEEGIYHQMEISYDSDYKSIDITVYLCPRALPSDEFPIDVIAEAFPNNVDVDNIPVPEDVDWGYNATVSEEEEGNVVTLDIICASSMEETQAAFNDYYDDLVEAGWTDIGSYSGTYYFVAPYSRLIIALSGVIGDITVEITENVLTVDDVNEAIVKLLGEGFGFDEAAAEYIASIDGLMVEGSALTGAVGEIMLTVTGEEGRSAIQDSIDAAIDQLELIEVESGYYVSADGTFALTVVWTSDTTLDLAIEIIPAEEITLADWLIANGLDGDAIPDPTALESVTDCVPDYTEYQGWPNCVMTLTLAEGVTMQDFITDYGALLEGAGFIFDEGFSCYTSEDGKIEIYLYSMDGGETITVDILVVSSAE